MARVKKRLFKDPPRVSPEVAAEPAQPTPIKDALRGVCAALAALQALRPLNPAIPVDKLFYERWMAEEDQ